MKFQAVIAIFASIVATSLGMDQPSFHTKGTPIGKPTGPLKPGEYWWKAGLSPRGPVVVLVSLPQQTMHVYRNGILIGRTSISSGTKGTSTPPGIFGILEKKETHYSKTYANAPMPNMQRPYLDRYRHALWPVAWLSGQPRLHPIAIMIFRRCSSMPLRKAVRW